MYHWIRDCEISDRGGSSGDDDQGMGECSYLIYHFLRTAGWTWIWECDGNGDGTNHCVDGSMQASGTTNWTAVGSASLAKTNSTRHMGDQCLQVTSTALNDGVRSAALQNMSISATYYLSIWSSNNTGSSWDVRVDVGGGSFASVGSIPNNAGVWTRYEFSFTTDSSANPRYFQVIDNNSTTSSIYIDSVMCWYSYFEYRGVGAEDLSGSPDGEILNSNEFSSASYTFVAGDVGKHICVWDTTNLGNTGAYKITSINGSDAVLDLRAGGTPALVSQTGLRWRMVDTTQSARIYDPGPAAESYAGWGLESPHSEKWRLFCRNNWSTVNDRSWLVTWSCPYDGDFNVDTGNFFSYVASSSDVYDEYEIGNFDSWHGAYLVGNADTPGATTSQRIYLQTDDDSTALFIALRPVGYGDNNVAHNIIGFSGADGYHTLRESFIHYGRTYAGANSTTMNWNISGYSSFTYGSQCTSGDPSFMIDSKMPLLQVSTGDTCLREFSTQRANPFSGERFLTKLVIMRDYFGYAAGQPSQKTLDTLGLWSGELYSFDSNYIGVDSNSLFHFVGGVYMELPSSGGVGLFEPLS